MTRPRHQTLLQLVIVLVAGAGVAAWVVHRADQDFRADLTQQAQILAHAVDASNVDALTGTAADLENPRYLRLKAQVMLVRSLYPQCRFIYFVGRKADGTIFIYLDSEPPDSPDYSPPGQLYDEATAAFRGVFDTNLPVTEGPIGDQWGKWVSALAPASDPRTGQVRAVLGMDVDGRVWRAELVRAALPVGGITLALVIILLAGSVLFARRAAGTAPFPAWFRHLELGLVGAVGITLTLGATWLAYAIEAGRRHETFERLATSQAESVVERLKNLRNSQLESLALYYMANEEVTDAEFQLFSESLTGNLAVTNWLWMPVVPAAQRAAFEASVRAGGRADFHIWEQGPAGRPVPAAGRAVYYPLLATAPRNPGVLGFDSGSEVHRRAALELAALTGLSTGTDPLVLLQQTDTQRGMVVYRPVFALDDPGRLRGFVGAAVDLSKLLKGGIAGVTPYLELTLLHAGRAPESIAASSSMSASTQVRRSTPRPFFAFGKVFSVTIYEEKALMPENPAQAGGLALVAGLTLTGTVMIIVRLSLRQRERLEQLVAEQTRDLRARTAFFEAQVDSSPDGILVVDSAGQKILQNRRMSEVWKIPPEILADPDDSKQVRFVTGRTKDPVQFKAKVRELYSQPTRVSRDLIELVDGTVLDRYTAPVRDAQGKYYGRIWSFRDITELRRAGEALRESEARYRSIIVVSNTGAWEYHEETDFLWCSPEYFGMLGRSAADFDLSGRANLKAVWLDLLHPDDRAPAAAHFATYRRGGSVGTYESYFRMQHRDGHWVWIWSRGQTLRDAAGTVTGLTVGTHIDITERKKAAMELEEAHHSLQERIKEVNCLYSILKLAEGSQVSLAEFLRDAVSLIPPAWLYPEVACARIGFKGQEFRSAGFVHTAWSMSTPILVGGETVGVLEVCYREERPRRHDGPFMKEERALLTNLATQFSFLIERRRAEEQLQTLSSIIEQAPLSVIITDLMGRIEYVNPKFCAVTGYVVEEVLGRKSSMLWSHKMQPKVLREVAQTIARQQVWTGEARSRKKNGDSYLENVVIAPLFNEQGEFTHYVALKDDITAQKRFEAETTAMLRQERKISEMKSQFISVTSHEFRSPLAAAMGSLELLERHASRLTEAKRAELLTRTRRSLARLTEIIDQVLSISRVESGRVAVRRMAIDLPRFVQDVVHEVEIGDRQQHRFVFAQAGEPGVLPVDSNLLHHILSNLLGNAVRYSPAGTTITANLALAAAEFTLTVSDEGIGIPEAERDRIFDPFIRGSNVDQIGGTGLGLNIVKRYVELMGGHIRILPREKGTCFEVGIPAVEAGTG